MRIFSSPHNTLRNFSFIVRRRLLLLLSTLVVAGVCASSDRIAGVAVGESNTIFFLDIGDDNEDDNLAAEGVHGACSLEKLRSCNPLATRRLRDFDGL